MFVGAGAWTSSLLLFLPLRCWGLERVDMTGILQSPLSLSLSLSLSPRLGYRGSALDMCCLLVLNLVTSALAFSGLAPTSTSSSVDKAAEIFSPVSLSP